ncbi:hypothetical protein [Amycolatopsis vastitatis]|uniref:Uncharacterized protein n=1 Tax=Amycolatopsis vastitatis TaxID=1905142 RepID=A0A229SKW7_9PSEU|nr:hypothetical protein [Amycolatopsis vastitatis]OXM59476.1 hypothetical protein CF165_47455 [Amycolatopsis vastitatis]
MTVRTGVTRAAIGLLTAGLLPLTLAVPAEATNYAYDGKDPIATGWRQRRHDESAVTPQFRG